MGGVMKYQPATLRLMGHEWGKAFFALACITAIGFFVGWHWAFVALCILYVWTLAALVGALGLMLEGRADEAFLDARLDAVERRLQEDADGQ